MVHKTDAVNLHRRYRLLIETGWILARLVLIGAFRADVRLEGDFQFPATERERITLEALQPVEIERPPPPPPLPKTTVRTEVISEEVIEDRDLNLTPSLTLRRVPDPYEPPAPPDEEEDGYEEEIFVAVEHAPEMIGGRAALQEAIRYPAFARKAGIEGRVVVQFTVDETGAVQDPRVLRGAHRLLNQEALRAVQQMRFVPGRQRGQAVPVQMSLPVTFRLQ